MSSMQARARRPGMPSALGRGVGHGRGVCIWLTGLSGSGKSTTAVELVRLLEDAGRTVTVLDGDAVRRILSPGLGYSRADRESHIRRIGFVAAAIVRHGGVAVCAVISPYADTRDEVRRMIGPGHFVEVFVDTPLEICESRDPKGLYAGSRRGEIADFTGIDDVYERPARPEIVLDTVASDPGANARTILQHLGAAGFLPELHAARTRSDG
jgi:sulfate adenylyltransferase